MSGARDLAGLVAPGRATPPRRTVAAPPPRRRSGEQEKSTSDSVAEPPARSRQATAPATQPPVPPSRSDPESDKQPGGPQRVADTMASTTVRISVNIPLGCKQWVARQAHEQQRFVSEIVMEALDRHGDDASPPSGRVKRVAVPDGTIYNIVLPADDRRRIDAIAARKMTTRSALLSEVLLRASTG